MNQNPPYTCTLLHADGSVAAEIAVHSVIRGWQVGNVTADQLSGDSRKALDCYNSVLRDQMLSYLDEAEESVANLGFRIRFADSASYRVEEIHIGPDGAVSFKLKDSM